MSLLAVVVATACNGGPDKVAKALESCIQPPVTNVAGEDRVAVEIAAQLAKMPLDAKLKVEFLSLVKADFQKLSDRNVSLLLFLRAIECYTTKGTVGEEIARELARTVREEWSRQVGFRGKDGPLTPLEKQYIEKSSYSEEILTSLARRGIGLDFGR